MESYLEKTLHLTIEPLGSVYVIRDHVTSVKNAVIFVFPLQDDGYSTGPATDKICRYVREGRRRVEDRD